MYSAFIKNRCADTGFALQLTSTFPASSPPEQKTLEEQRQESEGSSSRRVQAAH
jgi:hypothetical protein